MAQSKNEYMAIYRRRKRLEKYGIERFQGADPLFRVWRSTMYAGDCIVWTGSTNEDGYGRFKVNGKCVLVHRYVYERQYGAVANGNEVDHLCRNRCCVNYGHLEAVPHVVNVRRGGLAIANALRAKRVGR